MNDEMKKMAFIRTVNKNGSITSTAVFDELRLVDGS